jgi:hypothetical protein
MRANGADHMPKESKALILTQGSLSFELFALALHFQHHRPRAYRPDDAARWRTWRTTGLPGTFPESEGFRTILGSLWTAILLGSILGLIFPVQMSPLLLIQVIYRTLWLSVFVMPRLLKGKVSEVPTGIALVFLVIVLNYPWVIPWQQLFVTP